MLDVLDLHLLNLAFLLQFKGFWLGLLAGAFVLGSNMEDDSAAKPMTIGASFLAALPGVAYLVTPWLIRRASVDIEPVSFGWLLLWLGCAVGGLAAALWWLRHGVSGMERLGKKFTKHSSLERNRRTDVREIDRFLPSEIGSFDPLRHIDEQKGMFVGLNEDKRPVYIPYDDWKLSHVLLSGRTRSGKGVAAQILLTQAIRRKEFVIVLDPKTDAWMPHIFKQEAEACGQPYHFLDLRQGTHPQIDLFQGCDEETAENMLVGALSLAEKGEAADFYRLKDRRAARETARYVASHPGATPRTLLAEFGQHWQGEADGFAVAIQEMAELPAVNRDDGQGIDLDALEQTGGCLYVVGDMGNTRIVRMQRMLLVRLMMLAKKRDYLREEPRTITVFADEFKVHISRPFMVGLGAAAGWGLHCILAFQSLQDLADVPADLDRDAVRGAVMENCAVQLSYRIKDPETAEWLAASTGTILVDDESRRIEKNLALTETVSGERTVRLAERYFVDTNMLMNMPKGCGLLVGAGKLPSFCYTSPVKVERSEAAITPSIPAPVEPTPEQAAPLPMLAAGPAPDEEEDF